MVYQMHPEYFKAVEPMLPLLASVQKPPVHDVKGRRANLEKMLLPILRASGSSPEVDIKVYHTPAKDGFSIPIYHFAKKGVSTTQGLAPAIYYTHGGGYYALQVADFTSSLSQTVAASGLQMFCVDYRLAPEHPFPTPVEDCYAGLLWLHQHAAEFNVDTARIACYGESAGGGLAAALAIMARDRQLSPPIAKQILIYPMLDDRNLKPVDPELEKLLFFNVDDNVTGWTAYLGEQAGKEGVPAHAAAARVESVAGLPPAYIDVGTLDLFAQEDLAYAAKLMAAGIEVELHVYPGVPHAWEFMAKGTDMANRAVANRLKAMTLF